MPISSLGHSLSSLVDPASGHLSGRTTSIFGRLGGEVTRKYVFALFDALRRDLVAGKREVVRQASQVFVEELSNEGLTFADLRFFAQTLRTHAQGALASQPDAIELRSQIDDWFFELIMVLTMRFTARREEFLQARAVKLELQQIESQLVELQSALEEKTRLLEVIRQASTPIAPVVRGILVVPLVGMFDTFRAEVLTERLLSEVSRVHARAVILDISGVPVLDTASAQLIIRLARSVRLLGTEIFVVGMSPENARTIVALGIDLGGLRTLGTLQDGLAQALVLQRLKIAPL